MQPKLVIEQKITAFVNRYSVFDARPNGEKSRLVAFAQQKRLKIKEQIDFFTDKTKSQLVFRLRAEKVFDVHGRYLVEDAAGNLIGSFRKKFGQSLINSTWNILDESGSPSLIISERSQTLAILRRFIGLVPLAGEVAEILIKFFRYHFKFVDGNGREVGFYEKLTRFRDHYRLSMTDQAFALIDWRILAAQCVALDAMQSR